MGNLFCTDSKKGRGADDRSQPKVPPPKQKRTNEADHALLKLKTQRDKLQIQKKHMITLKNADIEKAKSYLKEQPPNKKFAAFCLKKKAHHEKLIENCDNSMITIIQLIDNVEMAQIQAEVECFFCLYGNVSLEDENGREFIFLMVCSWVVLKTFFPHRL